MADIYVGDVGTVITLDAGTFSLATATDPVINYRKPSGETGQWSAGITDNKVEYTTIADDIDEVGKWLLQAQVTISSWTGSSSTVTMDVGERIYSA